MDLDSYSLDAGGGGSRKQRVRGGVRGVGEGKRRQGVRKRGVPKLIAGLLRGMRR